MNFWLGATVALGVWFALQTVLSVIMQGHTIDIDRQTTVQNALQMVVCFVLANLLHLGVI